MPSDNLKAQPIRIAPFDPHTASNELWATFLDTRRALVAELWPSEPLLSDAESRTEYSRSIPTDLSFVGIPLREKLICCNARSGN
jgi:hypothetical protein